MRFRQKLPKRHKSSVNDPDFLIFTKKEIVWMILFIIIASFISLLSPEAKIYPSKILPTILIFSIIIITSISVKKIVSKNYAIKIEHKSWELQRWGYYKRSKFKKPVPIGIILPFFIAFFSIGFIKPFTFFQFDVENLPKKRLLKAKGERKAQRKEVIGEEDIAYTAASGFYALLLLALIGYLISNFLNLDFGLNLTKYSIYYGLWNLIPFGQLDGTKLFFGTTIAWIFITLLYIISLLAIIF